MVKIPTSLAQIEPTLLLQILAQKCSNICGPKIVSFQAFKLFFQTVETLGSWAPMGLKFIQDIGSRIAYCTGEKRSTSFLFHALSIATQRGNAASIAGTVPSMKKLDEVYYL